MPKHFYESWCNVTTIDVSGRKLHCLVEKNGARDGVKSEIIKTVQSHYEDPTRLAKRVKRLGLAKASKFLEQMMPESKTARSGHLGEILATESVRIICPPFQIPIKRLRWVDGRNSAMRGEDTIGIAIDKRQVRFLKGETKSGSAITPAVIAKARVALKANKGRPSQHAMGFLVERLMDEGNQKLALIFEQYMLEKSIPIQDMVHLFFALSGNDASNSLKDDLKAYSGKIEQHTVSLVIGDHQKFIKLIYEG
jgi:hypothetical protein